MLISIRLAERVSRVYNDELCLLGFADFNHLEGALFATFVEFIHW